MFPILITVYDSDFHVQLEYMCVFNHNPGHHMLDFLLVKCT